MYVNGMHVHAKCNQYMHIIIVIIHTHVHTYNLPPISSHISCRTLSALIQLLSNIKKSSNAQHASDSMVHVAACMLTFCLRVLVSLMSSLYCSSISILDSILFTFNLWATSYIQQPNFNVYEIKLDWRGMAGVWLIIITRVYIHTWKWSSRYSRSVL